MLGQKEGELGPSDVRPDDEDVPPPERGGITVLGRMNEFASEAAAAGRDAYRVARDRGQNARAERHAVRHVRHRGVLGLEHGAMFRRVRDFEYVAARAGCQQEVLVALAWKRGGGRIESVHLAREPSRAGGVEPRRLP